MNIIITGSSSGIGEALSKFYCSKNHSVFGISRRINPHLNSSSNFFTIHGNLTDENLPIEIVKVLENQLQVIDLVVLNAGILGRIDRMENQTKEEIIELMEINVWANKRLLDRLLKSGLEIKQVVAISSGASKNGNAGWGPYSISKAALNMLIKTYASEFPEVHFSSIAPGLVQTAMQDYISSISNEKDFPSVKYLKRARGTDSMPSPERLAPKLVALFQKAKQLENGIYLDIRDID